MRARIYSSLDALPPEYDRLFAEAGERNFFHSLSWYRCLTETASDPGDELRIYTAESDDGGTPLGMYVMRVPAEDATFPGARVLAAFENFYTLYSGPLVTDTADDPRAVIGTIVQAMADDRPRWDVLSFKMLDPQDPEFPMVVDALEAAGNSVQTFFQQGNWYETVDGRSFDDYVASRGKRIRRTLAWKARKLTRSETCTYELVTDESGLDEAIAAYQAVYAASWKEPEQYPDFVPTLMRSCARDGSLRLANLFLDGQPVSSVLYFVSGGVAIMYKSSFDERAPRNLSVGGVLSLYVLRHLIDEDHVKEIDYGIGDDPYKQEWMTGRRERWGILSFNKHSFMGRRLALRHIGGAKFRSAWNLITGR